MNNRKITFIMDGNFIFFENNVYSPHMHYQAFASRYANHFEKVEIFARAFDKPSAVGFKVAGKNTDFIRAPSNRGLKNYIVNIFKVISSVWKQVAKSDILMLRFPGNLAMIAMLICLLINKKFCVEVVAEPKDYFTKDNGFGRFYFIYRFIHCTATKIAVRKAVAVRYVTEHYLQNSYPTSSSKSFGFTDVYLGNLGSEKKVLLPTNINNKIINVGMMHNDSKGHINLIEACALLKNKGIMIYIDFVGDGIRRTYYEKLVSDLKLESNITFHGIVSGGEGITSKLLQADLFVLPSSQEGMPRSLLEAMYLHLPCIATSVGGIPELLPNEAIFIPNNSIVLAEKLESLFKNYTNLCDLQKMIIESISKIDEAELKAKYNTFFTYLDLKG